uniref:AIG1-type G domain-containing protein n=1 Tax=Anabas testudineus TaxID=64144 RepID=A0A7N6AA32_ANATE
MDCKDREIYTVKSYTNMMKNTKIVPSQNHLHREILTVDVDGCRRFNFGKESERRNRTIILLGATGSGKSTLINGIINYTVSVEWKDDFRFKLVNEDQLRSQTENQTSEVTVYKINHQEGFKVDYSLTIVDTPGFGDTRGIDRDRMIVEQLRDLFSSNDGVSEIDAVCFVVQSSLARLTPTQKYVFDSILSIFGKDVAENIRVLVTFADGQHPPVLEAINVSGVPCPKTEHGLPAHYKFNNSALFTDNKSAADSSDGKKHMKKFFFAALNLMDSKDLTLTKEVLRDRQQLEETVESLQKQIKDGLAKLGEIKETTDKMIEHKAEITTENFEFDISVKKPVRVPVPHVEDLFTNCQQCHVTCHYLHGDGGKNCVTADSDGSCTVCSGKCSWSVHFIQKYRWEYQEVQEKQAVKKLYQVLLDTLRVEHNRVQVEVTRQIESSAENLNRLKDIDLRPDPLSSHDYIDLLMKGEKSESKPGWTLRTSYLMELLPSHAVRLHFV